MCRVVARGCCSFPLVVAVVNRREQPRNNQNVPHDRVIRVSAVAVRHSLAAYSLHPDPKEMSFSEHSVSAATVTANFTLNAG